MIIKCVIGRKQYIKSKNIILAYINYLIFNFFKIKKLKITSLSKNKIKYLNYKLWFLVFKDNNRVSINKFYFFYTKNFLNLYSKVQELNSFIIEYIHKVISKKEKFIPLYSKSKNKFVFVKSNFIEEKNTEKKQLFLNVTFGKKNTFFNISSPQGKTIYLTTLVREGYIGRKRVAYTSIFSVASLVNKLMSNFFINKYCDVCIIYKGWSRFRSAIQAAFNKKKRFNLNIKYIKYVIKVPHNGCRPPKKRNRSRMQKYFVKKLA